MPELPPQLSIGLTTHEVAGEKTPHVSSFQNRSHLQESWQVMQASAGEKDSSPVNLRGQKDVGLFMERVSWENV